MSAIQQDLDKFIDSFTEYLLDEVATQSPGASKKVLARLKETALASYMKSDKHLDYLNQVIEEYEEYVEELENTEEKYHELEDFLHELASDASELVKYGNDEQKKNYIEYLDNCKELEDYGNCQSLLNTSGNLKLVI